MMFVISIILRAASLVLSYAISTFAAAVFLTFVLFLGSEAGWLEDPLVMGGAAVYVFAIWLITAQLALAPTLVIFLVAELARLSSLLMNVLAGGLCATIILTSCSVISTLESSRAPD